MKEALTRLIYLFYLVICLLIIALLMAYGLNPDTYKSTLDIVAQVIIFSALPAIWISYKIGHRHGWRARGNIKRERVKSAYGIKFTEHKEVNQ